MAFRVGDHRLISTQGDVNILYIQYVALKPGADMADDPSGPVQDPLVEDVLVEEISIDGMCGVY